MHCYEAVVQSFVARNRNLKKDSRSLNFCCLNNAGMSNDLREVVTNQVEPELSKLLGKKLKDKDQETNFLFSSLFTRH